ncbi:MAG: hypothetical protein WA962_09785, partial [Ornithinimicrobium sp.]
MSATSTHRRARLVDLTAVGLLSAVLAAGGTYGIVAAQGDAPLITSPGGSVSADASPGVDPNATPAAYVDGLD